MWPSGTASCNPGGWFFPGLGQFPHMHVLNPQGAFSTYLWSSLCLQLSPLHHSFLWLLAALLFLNSSLHLVSSWILWALSAWIPFSVLQPGNSLQAVSWSNCGAPLVSCLSGFTVLHCLVSSILKLLLPIVFVYFLVVSGRRVKLIPLLLLVCLLDLWARQR